MNEVILYIAAALTGIWGLAHLLATKGVVEGFGDLTHDNKRIITMEWIAEGIALISIAAFLSVSTAIQEGSKLASAVNAVAIATLAILAVVSLFTGFRVAFLPFKLCPLIFTISIILIVCGSWL